MTAVRTRAEGPTPAQRGDALPSAALRQLAAQMYPGIAAEAKRQNRPDFRRFWASRWGIDPNYIPAPQQGMDLDDTGTYDQYRRGHWEDSPSSRTPTGGRR